MIRVSWNTASVTAGRIRCFQPSTLARPVVQGPSASTSPRPKLGSHFRVTAKIRISRMPIRKVGSETPISESVISVCEKNVPRFSAA